MKSNFCEFQNKVLFFELNFKLVWISELKIKEYLKNFFISDSLLPLYSTQLSLIKVELRCNCCTRTKRIEKGI